MTFEMAFVFALMAGAIVIFAMEIIPADLVSILVMVILLVSGIVTPGEGMAGFSNQATVTVAAMFVLSAALFKSGAVNGIGTILSQLGRRSVLLTLIVMMIGIGFISAFINNTAAVAIFMPIMIGVAASIRTSPSKFLMPLSFASLFGGVCTLIGTSTNLLANSVAERHGLEPFGMFEFAKAGLVVCGVGICYMTVAGMWLIPGRRSPGALIESYGMGSYVTEIELLPNSNGIGKRISEWPMLADQEIDVLQLVRNQQSCGLPTPETVLQAGDVLLVNAGVEQIKSLDQTSQVMITSGSQWRKQGQIEGAVLVEAIIAPNSRLIGKTIRQTNLRREYQATVLAIRHRGELMHSRFKSTPLKAGDSLLIEVQKSELDALKSNPEFVIVSEVGLPNFRKNKIIPSLLVVIGVVTTATFGWQPIVVTATAGCVMLVLLRCLTLGEAYRAIDWRVIFLLAGVMTLGVALEKTGGAKWIAAIIMDGCRTIGPQGALAVIFVLTMLLTNVVSNSAAVLILAPIAIALAETQGVQTRPFLIAVTFAASLSLMTPIGYQTNMMIYEPGQYRFTDFLKIGTPLSLLLAIVMTWLIPIFWPF